MEPQQALVSCLARALRDEDLVPDISQACALAGWDVAALASGTYSEREVAEKLFLTPEEAACLLQGCRAACGREIGDAHVEGPQEGMELGGLQPKDAGPWRTPPETSPRSTADEVAEHEVSVQLAVATRRPAARKAAAPYSKPDRLADLRTSCPAALTGRHSVGSGPSPQQQRDYSHLPSYLRPTATFQARSKNAPEPIVEEVPFQAPVKKSKRFANVLAKVLAPTAAFLARVMSKGQAQEVHGPEMLRRSAVDIILKSPQGQRVTTAKPFSLHQSMRLYDATPKLTTEDQALLEAQKHAWKRNPVPKHIHESRSIDGFRPASTPKDPQQVFEPFNLASQERHTAEVARRNAELAALAKVEEKHRIFRALKFNKVILDKALTPAKPEPRPATTPVAPRLLVDQRSKHYELEVEPARRARIASAEKLKKEERERKAAAEEARVLEQQQREEEESRRQAEQEKAEVEEHRKSLVFKAKHMPGFESVFRPDLSKAPKVTQSAEFKLRTDARFGKALTSSQRFDHAASQLGSGRYDGCGYSDPFTASLRSSGQGARGKMALSASQGFGSTRSVGTRSMVVAGAGGPGGAAGATLGGRVRRGMLSVSQDLGAALSSALTAMRRSGASPAGPSGAAAAAAARAKAGLGSSRMASAASPMASARNSPRVMVPAA